MRVKINGKVYNIPLQVAPELMPAQPPYEDRCTTLRKLQVQYLSKYGCFSKHPESKKICDNINTLHNFVKKEYQCKKP